MSDLLNRYRSLIMFIGVALIVASAALFLDTLGHNLNNSVALPGKSGPYMVKADAPLATVDGPASSYSPWTEHQVNLDAPLALPELEGVVNGPILDPDHAPVTLTVSAGSTVFTELSAFIGEQLSIDGHSLDNAVMNWLEAHPGTNWDNVPAGFQFTV